MPLANLPYTDYYSATRGRSFIDLEWTSLAAGAVPALSTFGHSLGIASLVKLGGTGAYRVTFADSWTDLMKFTGWIIQAAYSAAGACHARITANNSGPINKTIDILITNAAGAAVDPVVGDIVYFDFEMQSF